MKHTHQQQVKRRVIRLAADVESELARLARESGRRQASLLAEAVEAWLDRQDLRIETSAEAVAKAPRITRQKPTSLATIRF